MDVNGICLLLLDVDGVMTDGSINIHSDGSETKRFFVRDGSALVAWRKLGLQTGIITGRPSDVTTLRARELGIDFVEQVPAMEKAAALERVCAAADVDVSQVAFLGDDLGDLPVLVRVGYPMAVGDAAEEVRDTARYVTGARGGRGAVREAVEHLLKSMNRWDEVLAAYGLQTQG
ncbi:MAG: HAD hydrolase family protein [Phycisphaerae bacterium]|nr:HAD hydrolase family protein [Phycisphaerae bacterium]